MKYANNPQAVYNGLISGQRNMFLSSSVAIVMIGFSNSFKNTIIRLSIKLCGLFILILSIFIGMRATNDFNFYIKHNENKLPNDIPVSNWLHWSYVTYIYCGILIYLVSLLLFRKIL